MSKDDIDKAVKDAEKFAAEDKKRREEIDVKNEADNLCYSVEKLISDSADKIPEDDKQNLNQKVSELKETSKSNDIEAIRKGIDDLQKVMYEVSSKLYKQATPDQSAQTQSDTQTAENSDNNVYDADYKDVDNN